jgi:hypothetical protein
LIFSWDIIYISTKIAKDFGSSLHESHVRIDVSLAPETAEWACLTIINKGNVRMFLVKFVGLLLCQGLH